MFNQHSINPNHSHSSENNSDTQKAYSQAPKRIRRQPWLLLVLLLLGVASIAVEFTGVTNVIRSFGKGGRPAVTLGLWNFTDVPDDFWAKPFMDGLVQKGVISGYPNDTFRPEQAITRAEFAAMLYAAFAEDVAQPSADFRDVPPEFWGDSAISNAVETGFFEGYPQKTFRPEQALSTTHALVALVEGLNLTNVEPVEKPISQVLSIYDDAEQIPDYAREAIATATTAGLVIHRPSVPSSQLNPDRPMTRAEAAASVYQALVYLEEAKAISSPYIVNQS